MSKTNCNTEKGKKQYQHLKIEDRIKIELLSSMVNDKGKRTYNNSKIAGIIGVDKCTISRELKKRIAYKNARKSGKQTPIPYNAQNAQANYLFKRQNNVHYLLDDFPRMKKYIDNKILIHKWSPNVIIGRMNLEKTWQRQGFCRLGTTTIYRAIHHGILKIKKEDTRRMTKFKPREKYKTKPAIAINKQKYSIDKRPPKISERLDFGHWELDTVIGKIGKTEACLLTITERKHRIQLTFKLTSKVKEEVLRIFKQLKKKFGKSFKKIFKSFTTDNGTEFSNFKKIMEYCETKFWFCHPYCSGEKGTVEKNNSMVRYFLKKGVSMNDVTNNDVKNITYWLNHYPRKILNYKTPFECLKMELTKLNLLDFLKFW